MRSMLLRFRRSAGWRGPFVIVFGVLATVLFVTKGEKGASGTMQGIGWLMVMLAATGVAATKYRRSSATHSHGETLIPLVRSTREFCLMLRPFGRDGEIILPCAKVRLVGPGLTPNTTMEQVVAVAARTALGLETYGIVDQNVSFAPPGATFMRASNSDWKMVARSLIQRAHSILLILPPGGEMGDGFAWEIEQIVRFGLQSRVIIVFPPCDVDVAASLESLAQVGVLLALLDGSGRLDDLNRYRAHEYEQQLPANSLLVKYTEDSRISPWFVNPDQPSQATHWRKRRRMKVGDATYLAGLVEALQVTEHELSARSFEERYPFR